MTAPERRFAILFFALLAFLSTSGDATAQPEVRAWGNMTGIRVDGQLMPFESSIRAAGVRDLGTLQTAKERQRPRYTRDGDRQIVRTWLDSLEVVQTVTSGGRGEALVDVEITSHNDLAMEGVYFAIDLPTDLAGGSIVQLIGPDDPAHAMQRPFHGITLSGSARGARISAPHRSLEVRRPEASTVIVRSLGDGRGEVLFEIAEGDLADGQTVRQSLTVSAEGEIDNRPVEIAVDATVAGRTFEGFGGNFRIQNPQVDPAVIEYNLDHLRVAWGRVEMPWRFWHPNEDEDPIEEARAGNLHPRVAAAMEMAQDLHQRGIPVMIAAWSGPDWAIEEEYAPGDQPYGLRGNALDQSKAADIYESIVAYVEYMREAYGVETVAFSFNESDLGINIRQTPEEHARLIRELGAEFEERGLPTKLLLGDTADANGFAFTYAAIQDPSTHPYIHAASFHSWRGWAEETLEQWDDIASRMNIPVIVGEGSIDAAAWGYPQIFEEPSYAMQEIDLYTRILNIVEPQSILQWQLTADYSVLSGGGVFGNTEEPLHPTQRFFALQQLASTPVDLPVLEVESSRRDVSAAALGDAARGEYAFHIVNNNAQREAIVSGLPAEIGRLLVFVTDKASEMEAGEPVAVVDGEARLMLPAMSFVSLMTSVADE